MGKKSRKKLERKRDFQKVKLKVGKKKPMPDNFTKTAFKSQGILLKEQFKASGDGSTAKGNIHEFLCHVNHYNAKVRTSTLIKLKELLTADSALIMDNVAALIQNIAHTFTDKDEKARQAGCAVMKQIMRSVDTKLMVPFFPTMCAHLSCAMTHLQEDIRLDALKILDLLLVHYPSLVINRSQDLLTNFVHQISQQGYRGSQDGGMQLSISPGSKFSGQKWRVQVLQRLKSFLVAIVNSKQDQSSSHGESPSVEREVIVSGDREIHVGIYKTTTNNNSRDGQFNILRSFTQQDESPETQDFTSNITEVADFVRRVIPLLIQSWMEARPNRHGDQSEVTLTPNSLQMLHGVLSVLQLLWKWLDVICQETGQRNVLSGLLKKFERQLVESFYTGFPYAVHEKSSRHPQHKPIGVASSDLSTSSETVNLLVCDVLSYLIGQGGKQNWKRRLVEYVMTTLQRKEQVSTEHAQMLLGITMRMMEKLPQEDSKLKLLGGLFKFYKNAHLLSQNKRLAMTCIADITILDKKREFRDAAVTADFIKTIPPLIIQLGSRNMDSSHHALEILHHSAAAGHPSAVSSIQEHFETLLDPKSALIQEYPERLQRQLMELLHWVTEFRLQSFRTMCSSFLMPQIPATTVNYAVQILACKLLKRDVQLPYQLSDFISFLITLSLGSQMEDLQKCQLTEPTNQRRLPSPACQLRIDKSPDGLLNKSQKICPVVCQSLKLLSEENTTWRIFQNVVGKLLSGITVLPYTTAYGILFVTKDCYTDFDTTEDFSDQFVQLVTSVLYASLHDYSSNWNEGVWEGALWQLAVDVLNGRTGLLSKSLRLLKTSVAYHEDTEQLRLISSTVTRLLQTEDLKQVWAHSRVQLEEFMTTVQEATKDLTESRWLAELKYESSLFLATGANR